MSFVPLKEIPTHNLRRAIIANAVGTGTYTIAPGTAIQPGATGHTSFVTAAAATSPILGIVVAIEYQNKITELTSVVGVASATTSANVGNDNETAGYWKVIYIPSNIAVDYVADTNNATGAASNDYAGFSYMNLITLTTGTTGAATLDTGSVAVFSGTQAQFFSEGSATALAEVPPGATKKVVCHVSKVL